MGFRAGAITKISPHYTTHRKCGTTRAFKNAQKIDRAHQLISLGMFGQGRRILNSKCPPFPAPHFDSLGTNRSIALRIAASSNFRKAFLVAAISSMGASWRFVVYKVLHMGPAATSHYVEDGGSRRPDPQRSRHVSPRPLFCDLGGSGWRPIFLPNVTIVG